MRAQAEIPHEVTSNCATQATIVHFHNVFYAKELFLDQLVIDTNFPKLPVPHGVRVWGADETGCSW